VINAYNNNNHNKKQNKNALTLFSGSVNSSIPAYCCACKHTLSVQVHYLTCSNYHVFVCVALVLLFPQLCKQRPAGGYRGRECLLVSLPPPLS